MNETEDFHLRRQLRALRQDIEPARDLWPGIQARLPAASARAKPGRWWPLALAVSLALAAVLGWQLRPSRPAGPALAADAAPAAADAGAPIRGEAMRMARDYQIALAQLQPRRVPGELAPALGELDRSADQILSALDHDPHSRVLLDTLRSTYDRRLALTRRAVLG
ncbi:MAG: hypothetical protein QM601_02160 [Pseudoxanthomonas sp.]